MTNRRRTTTTAAALLTLVTSTALAAGPALIRWTQPADCADIGGWELLVAPITTALPNPTPGDATFGASIANAAPLVCTGPMETTASLTGAGTRRVWLVAIGRDATTRSAPSNPIDSVFPLGAPVLGGVSF